MIVFVVLAVIGNLLSESDRYTMTIAMCWGIAAVGLDLVGGLLGQLNFGQAAFVGLGAYIFSICAVHFGWPVLASAAFAIVATGFIGFVIGLAVVRLKHFGAAFSTFFFGTVFVTVMVGTMLQDLTGSANGIPVPTVNFGGFGLDTTIHQYVVTLAVLVIVVGLCLGISVSRQGRELLLIKHNEVSAAVLGVRVAWAKLRAFVLAAAFAGLAGVLMAVPLGFLAPETFSPTQSIYLYAMVVVGGVGTIVGPMFGALLVTILPVALNSSGTKAAIIFAVILLVVLTTGQGGIYGMLRWAGSRVAPAPRGFSRSRPAASRTADPKTKGVSGRGLAVSEPAVVAELSATSASRDAESSPRLRVEGVSVEFGGNAALSGVSLSVMERTVHAIIGANGAGKTTLLNTLVGVQSVNTGRIFVGEQDVVGRRVSDFRRLGVARTFQTPSLVPSLNASENVKLGAPRRGQRSAGGAVLPVSELLDAVGLPEARRMVPAGDLSLAEQKLVDIARSLAGGATVALLDEPTAGLSEQEMEVIAKLIRDLRDFLGMTVVVIAHHLNFVLQVAEYVTVLDKGRVLAAGEPSMIIDSPDVVAAFVGTAHADSDA